jgi:outer membrane protein TolC
MRGNLAFGVLHEADVAVLKARLNLCQTKQERIKVYEDTVREAESHNKFVEARFKAGFLITEVDALKAKDYLLECQIGLERAKRGEQLLP